MVYTTPAHKEQPEKKKPFVVTPVHDLLLHDLHTLHRATAEQLTRLNYKMGMLTTVKQRLKDLSDNKYVLPLSHPSIRLPYMYALDRKGLNYLQAQGVDVREYFRPSNEEDSAKNFLFREHMLAISDILIHSLLFEKTEPSYRISSMLHERVFKNNPINSVFLRSRAFKTLFSIENITIAFATTKNHNRMKQMREWTRKELAASSEPLWLGQLFLFTSLPENIGEIEPRQLFLDPVWHTPADDENPVSLLGE